MANGIDYNAVLADLEARKAQVESAIAAVKTILASSGFVANGASEGVIRPENIPSHAFLTLSISEAAKKYLDMVKAKQTLPQIMQALERGGLPPAKYNTVYSVLRRRENQVGDILRMGEEWGLTEWYPNNPNLKKRTPAGNANPKKSKKKKKKKAVNKGAGVTQSAATDAIPASPKEVPLSRADAAVEILSEANGPLHAKAIAETLNRDYGKTTNSKNVAAALIQDPKKRFRNIGENTWELIEK